MPDHWMTFATFTEQRFFLYPAADTYSGVVLNANMIAHAPAGVAAFLMGKTLTRKYFIDPQTHAFQHEVSAILNKEGKVRQSIESLAKEYGTPVLDCLKRMEPLKPSHLEDASFRAEFVERVIRFQHEFLPLWMSKAEENDYLQLQPQELVPYAVVAPYFYLNESNFNRWFDVNRFLIEDSIRYAKKIGARLFVPLVISRDVLDAPDLRKALSVLCPIEADGIVLWIDNFKEVQESTTRLKNFLDLVKLIRKRDKQEIVNMHGGYFSVLAGSRLGGGLLNGVAHGPQFGEHRAVIPVGGGIPKAKFYVPGLHSRFLYAEAQAMFRRRGWLDSSEAYLQKICSCSACRALMEEKGVAGFADFGDSTVKLVNREGGYVRMEFPTTIAKQISLAHYLRRKQEEFDMSNNASATDLQAELARAYDMFSPSGEGVAEHLDRWSRALSGTPLSSE
jgi:hypothetical protein